jgi:hypothetical protein
MTGWSCSLSDSAPDHLAASRPNGPEAFEVWLGPGVWKPEGTKPRWRCDGFRRPSGVYLEVPGGCGNRGVAAVIEDDQACWAYQLAQVEQVDEHVVEDVASVHERGVGDEAIGQQTGQGDL